jgi:hypothetical protein
VLVLKPYEPSPGGQALPQVIAPSHTAVTDLDSDERQDVLVASLGNFFPTDDKVGKVVWLRAMPEGRFEATTLLEGVGRVSDVQAADFSSDRRLVVAVFGWRLQADSVRGEPNDGLVAAGFVSQEWRPGTCHSCRWPI